MTLKSSEYWKSRTYDVLYYVYVLLQSWRYALPPTTLMKANFGLPHGGAALASKYDLQVVLGLENFPKTILLRGSLELPEKALLIHNFAKKNGYPVVLKPDNGFTAKGIFKVEKDTDLERYKVALEVDYLAQAFVPGEVEFGLFFARQDGQIVVPSINQKFYPSVTGDGVSTLEQLARKDKRYSDFWDHFLVDHNLSEVLPDGYKKTLSFLGSNTLGSKFTNVSHLANPAIVKKLAQWFDAVEGYNFGRLDVKAKSIEAFQRGEFEMIEANGILSQPTNMMDPDISFFEVCKIWHRHASLLAKIARTHRKKEMEIMSFVEFVQQSKALIDQIETQHDLVQR